MIELLQTEIEEDSFLQETEEIKPEPEDDISHVLYPVTALEAGRAVHRYLELVDMNKTPDRTEIASKLQTLGLVHGADKAAKRLEKWFLSDEAKTVASAQKVFREVPFARKHSFTDDGSEINLVLSGTIDLLAELKDGTLVLLDYKYSRYREQPDHMLQLQLYDLSLRNIPGMQPSRLQLVYLIGPHVEQLSFNEDDHRELQRRIVNRINQVW